MRLHLTIALIVTLLLVLTIRANHKHRFTFKQVEEMAGKRAQGKYTPLPDTLPPQLKTLTPAQEAGIFWKDTSRLWRKKGLPFQVDFYHPLNSNPLPHFTPRINSVDSKGQHPLAYSPAQFNFLNLNFNPPLPTDLGFAGFYLRYPDIGIGSNPNSLDGFFSVLGSCYYRALAKNQVYGLSARGLAINTAGVPGKTEEFPQFTDWWLVEPASNATQMVVYALLDSPSVSGAYEFKISPGSVTSVEVHAVLFFRQKVEQLGIAPFSSMYEYGENAKDHFGDTVHPEIHDSDGLLMEKHNGEWVWRPLAQATQLQIYPHPDESPKGFGLIQRDRDFQHYQDLEKKYNVRPSSWVTPHGDWGKGAYQLTQLVTNNKDTDNVILFWCPSQKPNVGDRMDVSYTVNFYMNDAQRPPLAYCKSTFINAPAPPPTPPPAPATPVAPPASPSATKPKTSCRDCSDTPPAAPIIPALPAVVPVPSQRA